MNPSFGVWDNQEYEGPKKRRLTVSIPLDYDFCDKDSSSMGYMLDKLQKQDDEYMLELNKKIKIVNAELAVLATQDKLYRSIKQSKYRHAALVRRVTELKEALERQTKHGLSNHGISIAKDEITQIERTIATAAARIKTLEESNK